MATPDPSNVQAFSPLHIYDVPGVAISQIFEGEASAASFKDLFLSPDRLTPEERTNLADKLVGADANRATKALVGVITNPWVWLMFVTSPTGMKAIQSGLPWSRVGKSFYEFSKKSLGFWDSVRPDIDAFRGAEPLLLKTAETVRSVNALHVEDLAASRAKLLQRFDSTFMEKYGRAPKWHGEHPLELEYYTEGSAEHRFIRDFNVLKNVKVHQLDMAVDEPVVTSKVRLQLALGNEGRVEELVLDVPGGDANSVHKAILEAARKDARVTRSLMWGEWEALPGHMKKGRSFDQFMDEGANRVEVIPKGRLFSMIEVDGGKSNILSKEAWKDKFNRHVIQTDESEAGLLDSLERELKVDTDYDQYVENLIKAGKTEGRGVRRTQEQLIRTKDGRPIEEHFRELYGEEGIDFIRQERTAMDKAFVKALHNEEHYAKTGEMVLDDDKLTGLLTGLQREVDANSFIAGEPEVAYVQGKDAILQMIETDGLKRVGDAAKPEQLRVLKEELRKAMAPQRPGDMWWRPRNTYSPAKIKTSKGWVSPILNTKSWEAKQLEFAPYAATNSANASKRIAPLTSKELLLNPDDLKLIEESDILELTKEGTKHSTKVRARSQSLHEAGGGQGLMVLGLTDGETSRMRYMHGMAHLSLDTTAAGAAVESLDAATRSMLLEEVRERTSQMGGGLSVKVSDPLPINRQGKATIGEMTDRYYQSLASEGHRLRFRTLAIPGAIGNGGSEWAAAVNAHIRNKESAQWFVDSWVGGMVEKTGWGKDFIGKMRSFADFNVKTPMHDVPGAIANYLYLSHLGGNLGSVVMQMTQPLLLAGTVAPLDDVMGAYMDAGEDLARYAKGRSALGARVISDMEEHTLVQATMPFANYQGRDLLKWSSHPRSIDPGLVRGGGLMGTVGDVLMGPFAKMELFNRNYAAHLMKRMYAKGGVNALQATGEVAERFANDAEAFVLRTQFGQHGSNMPHYARVGIFKNPLVRMFTTFPVRSLTGAFDSFPRMGGEENYWNGLKNVMLRGMGMSAVVYEMGKGLMGADLSPALFGGAVSGLVGGDRALQKEEQMLPIPPVIRLPYDVVRGLAAEDMGLLTSALARTVPGGVALNRALGLAPHMPKSPLAGLPGVLQKQYVDYEAPLPTGEVPVFKGDGTLIGYKKPSEIVARALGVDLGAWAAEGGLDGYLVKQREEIVKYRQQYLMALGANDVGKARGIAADFQRRFKGLPLTVTKEQAHSYMRNRTEGRTERTLDRIPPEARWTYQKMVEMGGTVKNLQPGGLVEAATATGRDPFRRTSPTVRDEEAILAAQAQAQAGGRPPGAFQGFGGF